MCRHIHNWNILECDVKLPIHAFTNSKINHISYIKERGGGQNFSTSFWCDLVRPPYVVIDSNLFSMTLSFYLWEIIIEYICLWRFNSIIMTWNKWLVFTKSVIMGLNNISPWPCPLGFVCLPCVITWLFNTLARHAIRWCRGMSLASYDEGPWFETHTILCSISYFYYYHCFVLFALFFSRNG